MTSLNAKHTLMLTERMAEEDRLTAELREAKAAAEAAAAAAEQGAGKLASIAGDRRGNEFCGACFDPTGRYLFVNIQTPGVTFAITGPWAKGPL